MLSRLRISVQIYIVINITQEIQPKYMFYRLNNFYTIFITYSFYERIFTIGCNYRKMKTRDISFKMSDERYHVVNQVRITSKAYGAR